MKIARLDKFIVPLLFTGFLFSSAVSKNISVDRFNSWTRLQLNMKLHQNGLGLFAMAGSRYNHALSKKINGTEIDAWEIDAWLQELWIGPAYSKKVSKKLNLSANILYRPQLWYVDNEGGKQYFRNTIVNTYTVTYSLMPKLSLNSRIMFWDHLPVTTGDNRKLKNEFYIVPLLGLRAPIWPRVELMIDNEVYIKSSADKDDLEGTEHFYRNAVWTGGTVKITDHFKVTLNYVNMWTNLANTAQLKQQVTDHYILINATWSLNTVKINTK
jgi:hypothetical protein